MAVKWFYKVAGQEIGPLTAQQLKQLADEKRLAPSDPVRRDVDTQWVKASSVKGLFPEVISLDEGMEVTPVVTATPVIPKGKALPTGSVVPVAPPDPLGSLSSISTSRSSRSSRSGKKSGIDTNFQIPDEDEGNGVDLGFALPATAPDTKKGTGKHAVKGASKSAHKSGSKNAPPVDGENPEEKLPLTKKEIQIRNFKIMAAAGGGLLLLLIVVLIFVFGGFGGSKSEEEGTPQTEEVAQTEETATEEGTAEDGEDTVNVEDGVSAEVAGDGEAKEPELTEEEKLLAEYKEGVPGKGFSVGGMKFMIREIAVATQDAYLGKSDGGGNRYLFFKFRISNSGSDSILEYPAWGSRSKGVKLVDDLGNEYKVQKVRLGKDQVASPTQISDGSVTDTLVFTAPVAKAEYLLLELPSLQDDPEPYKFRIAKDVYNGKPKEKTAPATAEGEESEEAPAGEEPGEEVPSAANMSQSDLRPQKTDELSASIDELDEEMGVNDPDAEVVPESAPAPAPAPEPEMTEEEREQAAIRAELEEAGADFEEAENADQAPGLEVEMDPSMKEYGQQLKAQEEQEKKEKLRGKTRR